MSGRLWRAHAPLIGGPGSLLELGEEESHHVQRVLRLREGERLAVFDGKGREFSATIVSVGRRVTVRVGGLLEGRPDPSLSITLWQGLCRPERMDWLVQKATEVGVASVVPFHAGRSEAVRGRRVRLERWRRIALEAAKQSGRRVIPTVEDVVELPAGPAAGVEALLLEPGSEPIGRHLAGERPAEVWIAVGPEGGFAPAEVRALVASGWKPCSLGPRTLRAETAGPIAVALVLFRWGDLGSPGGEGGPAPVDSSRFRS